MNWDMAFYVQDGQIIEGPRKLPRRWFDRSLWELTEAERIAFGWLPSNLVTGRGYVSATVHADYVECVIAESVLDQLRAELLSEKRAELELLEVQMARAMLWLVKLLIQKNVIQAADIPQPLRDLRQRIEALQSEIGA